MFSLPRRRGLDAPCDVRPREELCVLLVPSPSSAQLINNLPEVRRWHLSTSSSVPLRCFSDCSSSSNTNSNNRQNVQPSSRARVRAGLQGCVASQLSHHVWIGPID